MILHVVEATYEDGYRIRFRFNDGAVGVADLKDALVGEMFEPLRDLGLFKRFRVDPELETIVWENGADFAPEFIRDRLLVEAVGEEPEEYGR
jgi:hypothetical protein